MADQTPRLYYWEDVNVDDMTREELLTTVKMAMDYLEKQNDRINEIHHTITHAFKRQGAKRAAGNGP